MLASVVVLSTCVSYAGTSVDWFFSWGMYPQGTTGSGLQAALPAGVAQSQAVLWQLLYSSDNIADPVDASNSGLGGLGYYSGNDTVLAYRTTPAGGDATYDSQLYTAGTQPAYESATTYTGYFYLRVFQSTSPTVGQWYYDSPKIEAKFTDLTDSGRSPQLLNGNTDGFNKGDAPNVQIQIVPEPSSMALLAIGLGVVALRRKFRA